MAASAASESSFQVCFNSSKAVFPSCVNVKYFLGDCFTDRDQGEGFVLSEFRTTSGTGESKQIITHCIHTTGNGCMKCHLLRMCQNVRHVLKHVVN